jgi:hypothetical protein
MLASHFRVYRAFRSVYLFFASLLIVFVLNVPAGAADESDGYRDALLAAAREKQLSADRYWDVLVHYKPQDSGKASLVDDPKFFLADDGKTNPEAELLATVAAFFQDPGAGDDHPRCRFIARYSWLKEQLNIDDAKLPSVTCAKYEEALANIKTKSAVLVFPAAHGNGPASMFGHTLIRIDSTHQSDLLSYAVNYAALANDTNGFIYTFKGLFGFYKGYYSILPYYEKVKEYNNIEHRDIWEYYLNLSEDEVRRMVMHIWEIKDTYSDYYFFTENCSYNLLFLLESARPSLTLTDPFRDRLRFWVIPSDTVRVVMESGIVDRVKYRPSLATKIGALASSANADEQKIAQKLVARETAPSALADLSIPAAEKVKILDLSAELVQYRYSRKELAREEYLKQFLAVLNTRSSLGMPGANASVPAIEPPSPEQGHLPGKIAADIGWRSLDDDMWYGELEWRPAYHDLMDPAEGYVEGAQINFFDLRARYYPGDKSVKLQSWRLLDILSLAPRDRFFSPVSWKVVVGPERVIMRDGTDRLAFRANPGGGAAYKSGKTIAYVMLESDLQLSNVLEDRFAFGVGPSIGVYMNLTKDWKVNVAGQGLFYIVGDEHRSLRASLRQSYKIGTNNAVELSAAREKTFDHYGTDIKLGWCRYF